MPRGLGPRCHHLSHSSFVFFGSFSISQRTREEASWKPTPGSNLSIVLPFSENVHCKKGTLFGHFFLAGCKKGALKWHFWAPFLHCTFSGLASFRPRDAATPPPVSHSWRPLVTARAGLIVGRKSLQFPRAWRRGQTTSATQQRPPRRHDRQHSFDQHRGGHTQELCDPPLGPPRSEFSTCQAEICPCDNQGTTTRAFVFRTSPSEAQSAAHKIEQHPHLFTPP